VSKVIASSIFLLIIIMSLNIIPAYAEDPCHDEIAKLEQAATDAKQAVQDAREANAVLDDLAGWYAADAAIKANEAVLAAYIKILDVCPNLTDEQLKNHTSTLDASSKAMVEAAHLYKQTQKGIQEWIWVITIIIIPIVVVNTIMGAIIWRRVRLLPR